MEDAVEAAKLIVSAHDDPNCSVHAYMKVKNKALSVIGTVGLARALLSSSERVKELEEALETFRGLVSEGSMPRYMVTPGAVLNAVIEEVVDPALRRRSS